MMFKVRPKEDNKLGLSTDLIIKVYAVEEDSSGYAKFFVYRHWKYNKEWAWLSAKHFEPLE